MEPSNTLLEGHCKKKQKTIYYGFCSMKWQGVFLLPSPPPPPGWGATPVQGYPPAANFPVPIYTPGWRAAPWEWTRSANNIVPLSGLEPGLLDSESCSLIIFINRPPVFHLIQLSFKLMKWTAIADSQTSCTQLLKPDTSANSKQKCKETSRLHNTN